MSDILVNALINAGVLGPIVVALGVAYARLQRKHDEIQEKRVNDAQQVVDTVLRVADEQAEVTKELHAALTQYAATLERLERAFIELREMLRFRNGNGGGRV